jgi:hypothetical protein
MIYIVTTTFKRNKELNRLILSTKKFVKCQFKHIIIDNDPSNLINFDEPHIIYLKNDSNIGPRKNVCKSISHFLRVGNEDDFMLYVTDDDYFIGDVDLNSYINLRFDLIRFNAALCSDDGAKIGKMFSNLSHMLFKKPYFIDDNRVLTGNFLSFKLAESFIKDVNNEPVVRDAWYPMQIWSYLSNSFDFNDTIFLAHTVGNMEEWGDYDDYIDMNLARLKIYDHLFFTYGDSSILTTKKIFLSRSKRLKYAKYWFINVFSLIAKKLESFYV